MGQRWKEQVDPDLRKMARMLPNFTFKMWNTRLVRLLEPLAPTPVPEGVIVDEVLHGGQRLLVFRPQGTPRKPGALLWLHGGGRVLGRPEQFSRHGAQLVLELGIVVVSASYRHAPEHPFPAALDDAASAWAWLVEQAGALGVDPCCLAVGGESAGGGLAAELTQRLHDEGGVQPCAQALVYPMLDDRTAADQALTAMKHMVWNNASNAFGWRSYLGVDPGAAQLPPYASAARREQLGGLPAAWIMVGDLDLFHDEDVAYADGLRAAGVPVHLEQVQGAFHGFFAIGRDEAPFVRVWSSMVGFLRRRLSVEAQASPPELSAQP